MLIFFCCAESTFAGLYSPSSASSIVVGMIAYTNGNLLEFFCWERCLHFVSEYGNVEA